MQFSLGSYIRHLRRQKSLTQTELGGDQFSKSYISAVERDQIVPSYDAIRFIARQLKQPPDYLEQLMEQKQEVNSLLTTPSTALQSDAQSDHEVISLLDLILNGKKLNLSSLSTEYKEVPPDPSTVLAMRKQGRYAFLKGMIVQEASDYVKAQTWLEQALALAPEEYQAAILDALGTNAFAYHSYHQALTYHLRAYGLLDHEKPDSDDLRFQIMFHCGKDYQMLGHHQMAYLYYDQARRELKASQNMQIAAQLYLGLGYSYYASLYQADRSSKVPATYLAANELERRFEQAGSFLLQSRTLYQVGGDWSGEIQARLIHTVVVLDLCFLRQREALQKQDGKPLKPVLINCASLLDDADEQCRQIILTLLDQAEKDNTFFSKRNDRAYLSLAFLIRSLCRRATIARLGGYDDTASRERSLAHNLAQRVLNSLTMKPFPVALLQDALKICGHHATTQAQSMLKLPDPDSVYHPFVLAEIYFAVGEVAEEIGSTTQERDWQDIADHCFQVALEQQGRDVDHDSSYLARLYQRYISILKQRLTTSSPQEADVQKILGLFQNALIQLQTW